MGWGVPLNIVGIVVALLVFLGAARFYKYLASEILQNDLSYHQQYLITQRYASLLSDIDFNRHFQKFEIPFISNHYGSIIFRYRSLYHIFGFYKRVLLSMLLFCMRENPVSLLITLIVIQSLILVLTIILRPLLYLFQNVMKIF